MNHKKTKSGIGLKTAVLSLSLLTIMAAAAVSPALAKISQAFPEVSKTVIKLTLTLPALLIIPFSLFSGWLVSKWTPRKVLITGLIIFCIGGIGGGLTTTIKQLLFFRGLLGVGVGLIMPLSTSLIADLFEGEQRTKMMGLSGSVSHLGGVLFLVVSGWLACISWRYAFAVYSLAVVSLALVLRWLPDWEKKQKSSQNAFRLPGSVWLCALLGALMMIAFYAVPTNMALFIEEEETIFESHIPLMESKEQLVESIRTGIVPEQTRQALIENGIQVNGKLTISEEEPGKRWLLKDANRSYAVKKTENALMISNARLGRPAVAGFALSAMTLAGVVSGIALAMLMRIMRRLFPAATIALMGGGFWLLGTAQSLSFVYAGVVCIGLSSGFMMPLLLLKVSKSVTPVARAFGMAIVSSGVYFGQFTSPIVLGKASSLMGSESIRAQFMLLAILLGVAIIPAVLISVSGHRDKARDE